MLRQIFALLLTAIVATSLTACGGSSTTTTANPTANVPMASNAAPRAAAASNLPAGRYPVQQATFDDGTGEYALMVLNTPAGTPPLFRTTSLRMARVAEGAEQQSYLETGEGDPTLYLTEEFKIEYVHSVTETQTDPNTGRQEVVVVRQESSFWRPFFGAMAGQMVANALFTPQYYVPPAYQSGGLVGYGGYGSSYSSAVQSYRTRYNEPPAVERNRTRFRQTGSIARPSATPSTRTSGFGSKTQPSATRSPATGTNNNSTRSTGSGFGSNTLRPSNNQARPNNSAPSRKSSFGSSGGSRVRSSGGGRRRR
ncbi:MAG: hypothetical protein Fur0042_06430 [Cyanophyceae cyanobacterium]